MSSAALSSFPTFRHGVHPPEQKDATHPRAIERVPFVQEYVLHLSQHIGAPSVAIVKPGQQVLRGEMIAEPAAFVSTSLHSPVTGTVKAVEPRLHPTGKMLPAIVIEADPYASQKTRPAERPKPETLSNADLVKQVQRIEGGLKVQLRGINEDLILMKDGYSLESRAGEILEGLGIPSELHALSHTGQETFA